MQLRAANQYRRSTDPIPISSRTLLGRAVPKALAPDANEKGSLVYLDSEHYLPLPSADSIHIRQSAFHAGTQDCFEQAVDTRF
jgi:hypothetical protein